jgi:hypothetical protein
MRSLAVCIGVTAFAAPGGTPDCAKNHPPSPGLGYQARPEKNPDRCEGEIQQYNAYHGLELLGFTSGSIVVQPALSNSAVQLYWPQTDADTHLRATSVAERFYYQMDYSAKKGVQSYRWSLDVLGAESQRNREVALVAFTGSLDEPSPVYYAVASVPNPKPGDPLVLRFRTNTDGVQNLEFKGCSRDGAVGASVQPPVSPGPYSSRKVVDVTLKPANGRLCLTVTEVFANGATQPKDFLLRIP